MQCRQWIFTNERKLFFMISLAWTQPELQNTSHEKHSVGLCFKHTTTTQGGGGPKMKDKVTTRRKAD